MAHPPGVHLGTEQDDGTIRSLVGFQAFENRLRIMEHDRGWVQLNVGPRLDAARLPSAVAIPGPEPKRRYQTAEFQFLGSEVEAGGRRCEAQSKINIDI